MWPYNGLGQCSGMRLNTSATSIRNTFTALCREIWLKVTVLMIQYSIITVIQGRSNWFWCDRFMSNLHSVPLRSGPTFYFRRPMLNDNLLNAWETRQFKKLDFQIASPSQLIESIIGKWLESSLHSPIKLNNAKVMHSRLLLRQY